MKTVSLSGSARTSVGKKDAKTLRKQGLVPGVLYGNGENIHFQVKENELNKLVLTPVVSFVELDIEGKKYKSIIQDTQYHPVSDRLTHIDLLSINEAKPIKIAVPIKFEGTAPGIIKGGKLNQVYRKLKIEGLPSHIPSDISVNISKLDIGHSVRVRDIHVDGLTLLNAGDDVVVSVKMSRAAMKNAQAEAAEETKKKK